MPVSYGLDKKFKKINIQTSLRLEGCFNFFKILYQKLFLNAHWKRKSYKSFKFMRFWLNTCSSKPYLNFLKFMNYKPTKFWMHEINNSLGFNFNKRSKSEFHFISNKIPRHVLLAYVCQIQFHISSNIMIGKSFELYVL